MTDQDMRFGVIRSKHEPSSVQYALDGEHCPNCHLPTEIADTDPSRRFCTNRTCNALIKEDVR